MKRMITGLTVLVLAVTLLAGAFAADTIPGIGLSWGSAPELAEIKLGKGTSSGNQFMRVLRYDDLEFEGYHTMGLLHFRQEKLYAVQLYVMGFDRENPEPREVRLADIFRREYGEPVRGSMDDAETFTAVERADGDCLLWVVGNTGIWLSEGDGSMSEVRFVQLK